MVKRNNFWNLATDIMKEIEVIAKNYSLISDLKGCIKLFNAIPNRL